MPSSRSQSLVWGLTMALGASILIAVLLLIIESRSGSAHAGYDRSEPAADATITTSPEEVVVYFTQELQSDGTLVAVLGPDGSRIDLQDSAVDLCDASRKRVTVSLPENLPNGEYIVQWQTMSLEDAEADSGSFTFTLNAPAASPEASPGASPEASPAASPSASPTAC